MEEKVIVFGTGSGCGKMLLQLEEKKLLGTQNIVAFLDNNERKWGTEFNGRPVMPPDAVRTLAYDVIIVASVYFHEIDAQLQGQYQVPYYKILSARDYLGKNYARRQYLKYYGPGREKTGAAFSAPEKIVVYTTNFGRYDELEDPEFTDEGVDYVCFTDDESYRSDVWKTEYISFPPSEDLALKVREYKLFPDRFFPGYEVSVWVDSKFQVRGDLRRYIAQYMRESSLLHFPHFERDCIYDEALECYRVKKGDPIMIGGQIYRYYMDGYPRHNGLLEGGCIVRAHHEPRLKKVMEDWWEQVKRYSRRDQISLPYVCWKNRFRYDICDLGINRCEYLDVRMHREEREKKCAES